ncbi:MAG: peptidoglycan-binding protein [Oscillospiraceae bacterium]|nr:peptidoglycan-binding protein [Oscillospiraceae bacterium]
MSKPSDVITIALAEVGYREKASNASLDAPQANAGSGNWTKFARDLAAAGYYNGNKNGYAWCDVFVDWCFYKAFGAEEGQRVQCQTGDLGAACIYSAQYYMMQGRYDQTPKPGDQVFFNVNGQIGHTGIVVEVTDSHIIVVEGNSGNRVQKLTYNRKSAIIAGYGHPRYDEQESEKNQIEAQGTGFDLKRTSSEGNEHSDARETRDDPSSAAACLTEARRSEACEDVKPPASAAETELVHLPLLKSGAVSNAVKNAQALLICHGYACGGRITAGRENPDGEFGPVTEKAVKSFQHLRKLKVDGEIGVVTWTKLLMT